VSKTVNRAQGEVLSDVSAQNSPNLPVEMGATLFAVALHSSGHMWVFKLHHIMAGSLADLHLVMRQMQPSSPLALRRESFW
jgi:hypothetical protein